MFQSPIKISKIIFGFPLVFLPVSYRNSATPIPETDAIFEQLSQINQQADNDPTTLRLSLDAKATVKIGPFSRGGKNRVPTFACDHDFTPKAKLTDYGIFLPQLDELFLYFTTSKVTPRLHRWYFGIVVGE